MSNKPFAKLFEFDDLGQVLVTQKSDESKIEYTFDPQVEGLGLSSSINTYGSWSSCDKAFGLIDESKTYEYIKPIIEDMKAIFDEAQLTDE